jgi:hypothetical protein
MKLPFRPGTPRTLRGVLLRVLLPRTTAFAMVVLVVMLGRAMAVAPSAAPFEAIPTGEPTWSAAEQAAEPDCVPSADWPTGTPGSAVVVHRFSDDSTQRLPFLTAWRLNHNDTEVDDVWVLGVCP